MLPGPYARGGGLSLSCPQVAVIQTSCLEVKMRVCLRLVSVSAVQTALQALPGL
jgi:hypothetical protein